LSWITGVGLTPFGRHEDHDTVDLMSTAAAAALDDAGLEAGLLRHVPVMAGESRLTGQSRDAAMQTLAVLMRDNAATHPGGQFRERITVADVLAVQPIAEPLRILDCCPVSDGGAAIVISRERTGAAGVRIRGAGQAYSHQHIFAAPSFGPFGAALAASRAKLGDTVALSDVRYAGVYDSFTITPAILLEELGLAPRGRGPFRPRRRHATQHPWRPALVRPLRRGRCHGAPGRDAVTDDRPRQVRDASVALLHGDGGVLSSHVTLWLEQTA